MTHDQEQPTGRADFIGEEALWRVREGVEGLRVVPSTPSRVAARVFDLTPPQWMSVLRVFAPAPAGSAGPGPRLVELELDRETGMLHDYDPDRLDAAAQAFVSAVVEAWGPALRAYLASDGQEVMSQVTESSQSS